MGKKAEQIDRYIKPGKRRDVKKMVRRLRRRQEKIDPENVSRRQTRGWS